MITATKRCRRCQKVKPRTNSYFHHKSDSLDGYKNVCKPCSKKLKEIYKEKNK